MSAPAGAGFDTFDWRVSIATIAADGPFSTFPGVDRTIMLLTGGGVRLQVAGPAGERAHELREPLVPYVFTGEHPVEAHLLGGVSTDLNLMVRRIRGTGHLTVVRGGGRVSATGGMLLAITDTAVVVDGERRPLPAGSGIWWTAPATVEISTPDGQHAESVVATATWNPNGIRPQ